MSWSCNKKYKVVILGEPNVGKTSIITSYMFGVFNTTYNATVGIDFMSKTVYTDHATVRMQIWDTAGQERFRSLIPGYIRESSVAIIVYDITDYDSFKELPYWVGTVGKDIRLVIVGNKCDLDEQRKISTEEGQAYAREQGIPFFETSAKSGREVEHLFSEIANMLAKNTSKPETLEIADEIQLQPMPIAPNNSCNCQC